MKLFLLTAVFCIIFNMQNQAQAYIDPGFGSMMLSVCLGIATTLYFLFHSFIIYIKRNIIKKTSKKLISSKTKFPIVIYSDGKEYFNVFKPVIEEFEKRQIPLLFYTSSIDDPFFEQNYKYTKGEYIGKNNEAYIKLAFLKADICLMSTPQLDVLQLKRSKFVKYYIHIFHGITTSMDYRLFSLDYYDAVLCDGEFQIPLIRELEEKRNTKKKDLAVIGSTYMDVLNEKLKTIKNKAQNENLTVLVAPSWGENSIFNKYPKIIQQLAKTNYNIIIRPHPHSLVVEKEMVEKFQKQYENNKNIKWDFKTDNIEAMAKSDILITDYSTVMFDYAFLFNKTFLYTTFNINKDILDISDIEGPIWRFEVMKKIGKEINENNIDDIESIIKNTQNENNKEKIQKEIKEAKEKAWFYQGESGKKAADFILLKQKELKEETENVC